MPTPVSWTWQSFSLTFAQKESCGKCTFCRVGTTRLLEILERIAAGKGSMDDLDKLKDLSRKVKDLSLCGLGKTPPNPIITTLKHFRNEYEEHIKDKNAEPASPKELIDFSVIEKACTGCHLCYKNCPVDAISGTPKEKHHMDQKVCLMWNCVMKSVNTMLFLKDNHVK